MFGGNLQSSAVVAVDQCDLLVAAFSHQLYLFSLSEATIKDKVAAHRHPLLHLHLDPRTNTLSSLDDHGFLISFRLGKHALLEQLEKRRLGKALLREGRIRASREAELEVLSLAEDGTLTRHVGNCDYLVSKDVARILLLNDDYLVLAKNATNTLEVFSAVSLEKLYEYESPTAVTSAEQYQNSLIIGNQQGKIIILVGFLTGGVIQLTQKLQWHVHAVSSLRVDGSYLYSAGEEGVVVVWHLRENRRDFLPRIGSAILNLQLVGSSVYCFLADNSLKAIDLANDKSLLHYKLVLNPNAQLLSESSRSLAARLLLRPSPRGDRLFLRGGPGRIQEIDLYSGINSEHAVVSRNYVSRLDAHLPAPHQLTDLCLSRDSAHLAVAVQGVGCRSLRFYGFEGGLRLVSKVENCHRGEGALSLLALSDSRFLSYSVEDSSVKVWRLNTRRKESLLEIDEQFWCCDYEISFRQQLPKFVSVNGNRIVVTYAQEFIAFNAGSKSIEGVYRVEEEERQVVAVVPQNNKLLVFFDSAVELASTFNNSIGHCQRLLTLPASAPRITTHNIVVGPDNAAFALLLQQETSTALYYTSGAGVSHISIPASGSLRLEEVFWLKERLLGVDSSLFFYDFTHERELVQLRTDRKDSLSATEGEAEMEAEEESAHYQQLYRRYLERQFRKDKSAVQRSSEVLAVTPSISACFQMLAPQLFL